MVGKKYYIMFFLSAMNTMKSISNENLSLFVLNCKFCSPYHCIIDQLYAYKFSKQLGKHALFNLSPQHPCYIIWWISEIQNLCGKIILN